MKKLTISAATEAYGIMTRKNFLLSKAGTQARIATVRAAAALRRVSEDYNRFTVEAAERLRPEGFADIAAKIRNGGKLTQEEAATAARFESELSACLGPERQREAEVHFTPLTEEAMSEVMDSNPQLSVADMLTLDEVLAEEPQAECDAEERKEDADAV